MSISISKTIVSLHSRYNTSEEDAPLVSSLSNARVQSGIKRSTLRETQDEDDGSEKDSTRKKIRSERDILTPEGTEDEGEKMGQKRNRGVDVVQHVRRLVGKVLVIFLGESQIVLR